jgi:palmitoyl transferase
MSVRMSRWMHTALLYSTIGVVPCFAQHIAEPNSLEMNRGSLLGAAIDSVTEVADRGEWDIYLSGYAHHSRDTYSSKRIKKLNERAWGLGLGKTIRNEHGNDESLYVLAIRDSNRNIQWSAGYSYQWIYPLGASGLEAGAGLSAGLIQRKDWFDGVPFPAILPTFSAGTKNFKLMGTYVPRISTRKGKGDVLFLFAKYTF